MKLGMSSACFFGKLDTEDAVDIMGKMGIDTCELFLSGASEYDTQFIDLLIKRMDGWKMKATSVHALSTQFEPQLFSISHRQREDAEKVFITVLKAAQKLGAGLYVMHGPTRVKRIHQHTPTDYERYSKLTARLFTMAQEHNVRLCWENVHWCTFALPQFAAEIQKYEGCESLGFVLDTKQALQAGHEAGEYIRAMGKNLSNVHICDCYEENGRIVLGLPGYGRYDYHALKAKLDVAGYNGPVILEVYKDSYKDYDMLKSSYKMMQEIFEG